MKRCAKNTIQRRKATALMDESHIVPAGDVVLNLHEYLDTLADDTRAICLTAEHID